MESKRPLLVRIIAKTRLEAPANKNKSDQYFLLINLLALSFHEKSKPHKVVEGSDGFQPEANEQTNRWYCPQTPIAALEDVRVNLSRPPTRPAESGLKSPGPSRSTVNDRQASVIAMLVDEGLQENSPEWLESKAPGGAST